MQKVVGSNPISRFVTQTSVRSRQVPTIPLIHAVIAIPIVRSMIILIAA
jgi:hypothetical protein